MDRATTTKDKTMAEKFIVRSSDNGLDKTDPNYRSGLEAIDSNGKVRAIFNGPGKVTISEIEIESTSGIGACLNFRKLQDKEHNND